MEKTITVLGCGWLGLPLAAKLAAGGWQVKGSTTTPEKLHKLAALGISPFLIQLNNPKTITSDFLNSEVLLINVPPSLRKQAEDVYLEQMKNLLKAVTLSPVKQVLFISSTSVYPDLNKDITSVNEADTQSALYISEQLFVKNGIFTTSVLRFAGLFGPGRHPSRFFAGKQNVPNGRAPVNLIHLDDCIGLIETLLEQQLFGFTWHAAAPSHPAKAEFYTAATQQAGLPLPGFINELKEWKTINSTELINATGYVFKHPDLMQWATD